MNYYLLILKNKFFGDLIIRVTWCRSELEEKEMYILARATPEFTILPSLSEHGTAGSWWRSHTAEQMSQGDSYKVKRFQLYSLFFFSAVCKDNEWSKILDVFKVAARNPEKFD